MSTSDLSPRPDEPPAISIARSNLVGARQQLYAVMTGNWGELAAACRRVFVAHAEMVREVEQRWEP